MWKEILYKLRWLWNNSTTSCWLREREEYLRIRRGDEGRKGGPSRTDTNFPSQLHGSLYFEDEMHSRGRNTIKFCIGVACFLLRFIGHGGFSSRVLL